MGIVKRSALRLSIISYIGMVLGYLNKAVLFIALLTVDQMGLLYAMVTFTTLFGHFTNLGVTKTMWKFFPYFRKDENSGDKGFLTLNSIIVLIGIVVGSVLMIVFKPQISAYFEENSKLLVDYYYWLLPSGIGYALFRLFEAQARSIYQNVASAFAYEIIYRVITSIALGLFALDLIDFSWLLIIIAFSQFIPTFILFQYLLSKRMLSFEKVKISKRFKKILFNYSLFTYSNSMVAILVTSLDVIMISAMIGLDANAVYTFVLFVCRALLIPYSSLLNISTPLVSEQWKKGDMKEMNLFYKRVSSISLFIALFAFVGTWASIYDLFAIVPQEFAVGIEVFFVLMIGKVVDSFSSLNGVILVTSKKFRYDVIFSLALVFIVFGLNYFLIPIWGILGAAISTTSAVVVYNLARLIFVWQVYKLNPFKWSQLYIVLLAISFFALIEFLTLDLGNKWLNIAVRSVLVTIGFVGIVYKFKFEKDIVEYLDKFLVKLRLKKTK